MVLFAMLCKLSELVPGEAGEIRSLELHGPMRRRLQDLGFLPGVCVNVLLRGVRGGISAYGVHGRTVALRCADAAQIIVEM